MRVLRAALVRLRATVRRRATDTELDEELRCHLERDVEQRVARGEPRADAEARARRAFGNVTVLTEQAREASRIDLIEQLRQDTRYAMRGFFRSPRFALTVILTIGLGLGLVTTAFTFFDAYVLRPLAVRDPRSLYEVELRDRWGRSRNATYKEYQALARSNPAFTECFAYRWLAVRRDGQPIMFHAVTPNYFNLLGVAVALGRPVTAADAGGSPVLVLSHNAWRTKFGSDSTVVGRRLAFRDRTFEIIGVAPEGFDGLTDTPPDFWVPIQFLPLLEDWSVGFDTSDAPLVRLVGRVNPGMSAASAERALTAWAAAVTADEPERNRVATVALESRATAVHMSAETLVQVSPVFLAFALVLLIACANVANMMLARGMSRQREFGIRLALGAARGRLVWQLMTEALLLAVPAGIAGFLVSRLALDVGVRILFATVPEVFAPYVRVISLVPDMRLFAFVFVAAMVSAIAFGLVPALQTSRTNVVAATRGEFTAARRPSHVRNALVIAQITICSLLLVSAGVLLRGAGRIQGLDLGFRTDGIVLVNPEPSMRSRIVDRLRGDPSAVTLEAASPAPFDGRFPQVAITGDPAAPTRNAGIAHVTPGYWAALGVPVVRGRSYTLEEARSKEAVVLVSEATARQLWPNGDVLGATIRIAPAGSGGSWTPRSARVIGVVGDVVTGFVGESKDHPTIYEPATPDLSDATLIVAPHGGSGLAKRSVLEALEAVDPGGSSEVHTLEESAALQVYPFRAAHWVASGLGVLALLLTITGIYGVLAYVVALRQKEIGIRVALGATRTTIVGMVVRQSIRMASVGVVVGGLAALGVSKAVASYLPVLPAFDARALLGATVVVLLAALGAAFVPSRRAANVDVLVSLKE